MLSKRLKAARLRKKLTQQELANRLKTTKGTISNYENGHSTPSNEMLKELALILEVSTDYLLGVTDALSTNTKNNDLSDEDIEMLKVLRDPKNELFFKEMATSEEEKLERLRKIWDAIKDDLK